jgi:hypothetical protein
MSSPAAPQQDPILAEINKARQRWLAASACASAIAAEVFQPGNGYGSPDAVLEEQHRLETARREAERLYQEYQDLERGYTQQQMLRLQRSQELATWASFAVAAVVGVATIASVIIQIVK